ncbi:ABC transporter substrate-binding protein [Enterococcus sp. LJL99]
MKKATIISFISILFIMVGCGQKEQATDNSAKQNTETGYPLTIKNFSSPEGGQAWKEKEQTFEEVPKKVVANTQPAAELLLHLGLKDNIAGVGAVFGLPDKSVEKEFAELNHLSGEYIGKELALSVDPDLVYGRGGLFDNQDWGVGTVDSINDMGINTYVLASSVTGSTFDSVYEDIDNLGKIFNVEDKAEAFKKELKDRQKVLEEEVSTIDKEQKFAYLHMSEPSEPVVYAAHNETFFNDIFGMLKLDNVFKDETGDVSVETLIETDPDVLIVPDWSTINNGIKGSEFIEGIKNNKKLSSMKAVKNNQIYAVDYNYMFSYGYQSLDGVEKLAEEMQANQNK